MEHAVEAELAVRVPMDVAVLAAGPGIPLVEDHLVLARAEPLRDELGLQVRPMHQRSRRNELPLHVDEGHTRRGGDRGLAHR